MSPLRTWTDATMLMLSCLALSAAPLHQSFVAAASSKRSPIDLTLPRTQTLPRTNRKHISHTHTSTCARAHTHTYTDSRTQTHPHTHTRILIQTHARTPESNGPSQPKQPLEHKLAKQRGKKPPARARSVLAPTFRACSSSIPVCMNVDAIGPTPNASDL